MKHLNLKKWNNINHSDKFLFYIYEDNNIKYIKFIYYIEEKDLMRHKFSLSEVWEKFDGYTIELNEFIINPLKILDKLFEENHIIYEYVEPLYQNRLLEKEMRDYDSDITFLESGDNIVFIKEACKTGLYFG